MSYSSLAKYYDKLTENVNYKVRGEYISNFLLRNNITDGIMLDLACGTGQMSVFFAEKGYDVIGVDASEEMLSVARENAMISGNNILFICQEMQELDLYGTVKSCICTMDGINHLLTEQDVLSAFMKVSLFMEKDGIFIFDVNTIHKHKDILGNNAFVYDQEDSVFLVWQNEYYEDTNEVDIILDLFEKDGEHYSRKSEDFTERAYSEEFLSNMLKKSGFDVLGIYDELQENDFNEDSERIYFVARKN